MGQLHRDVKDDYIHSFTARTYADIAARDADTDFQVTTNIDKPVRVNSPLSYFVLSGIGPATWVEFTNVVSGSFLALSDTPGDYAGSGGLPVRVNAGETGLEFLAAVAPAIGSIVMGGNGTPTSIPGVNTFVDLNLGAPGAVLAGNNSGFTLSSATTGEIEYIGNDTLNFIVQGIVSADKGGAVDQFNFRALKNGAQLPAPDNVDIGREIEVNLSTVPLLWPVTLATNDTFKIQVENADDGTDLTITSIKLMLTHA